MARCSVHIIYPAVDMSERGLLDPQSRAHMLPLRAKSPCENTDFLGRRSPHCPCALQLSIIMLPEGCQG